MTNSAHINMPINRAMGSVACTITVTGMKTFNFRAWLGIKVMALAAWILPLKTSVEVKHV